MATENEKKNRAQQNKGEGSEQNKTVGSRKRSWTDQKHCRPVSQQSIFTGCRIQCVYACVEFIGLLWPFMI